LLPVSHGQAASPPRGWPGVVLSTLCFVHCLGAAALVPLLPAAFSFLTDSVEVEWGLFGLSAALAARVWWGPGAPARVRAGRLLVWLLAIACGVAGLLHEHEALLQVTLAALAALQLQRLVQETLRTRRR
jgi:hypothetical protein